MTRIKKERMIYKSRAEFENAVDKISTLQLELEAQIAQHNEAKALEDKKHKADVKRKQGRITEIYAGVDLYVDVHREELLGDKQSSETKLGLFGYRKSPGIIKALNSKWTIGKSIVAIKEMGKAMADKCLKVTTRIDKDACKKHLTPEEMASVGLRVDYPEEFWVEPKRATETPEAKIK